MWEQLLEAIREKNAKEVIKLIKLIAKKTKYLESFNLIDDLENILQHYAVQENDLEALQILLANGANPNIGDEDNFTPLQRAILNDYKDLVYILIVNKANVNAVDNWGNTNLIYAINARNLGLWGSEVIARNMDVVELLIANGASVNAADSFGRTILQYAVQKNDLDVVKTLIAKGAIVNKKILTICNKVTNHIYEYMNLVPYDKVSANAKIKNIVKLAFIVHKLFEKDGVKNIKKMLVQVSNVEHPDIYKELFNKLVEKKDQDLIKTGLTINSLSNMIINNLKDSCFKKISFQDTLGKTTTLDKYILQDYQSVPSLYKITKNFIQCELQAGNFNKDVICQTLPLSLIDDVLGEQLHMYELNA